MATGIWASAIYLRKKERARLARFCSLASAFAILLYLGAMTLAPRLSRTEKMNLPAQDNLAGTSIGNPSGIRWVRDGNLAGAYFSPDNSSKIEYPNLIPTQGTIEFWIKVDRGFSYNDSKFSTNSYSAMIFSSDAQGGDVTWPGTTKVFVYREGRVSFWMATAFGNTSAPVTWAVKSPFRFGEWHAIGFSYGSQGQYIMVDGQIVAAHPERAQTFGSAGTHQKPLDIPTIGDTTSHFWAPHRYDGGFEGILARFRVSATQKDWSLARGIGD